MEEDAKLNDVKLQTLSEGKIFMSEIKDFNDSFDGKGFFYNPRKLEDISRLEVHKGRLIDDLTIIYMALLLYNVKHKSWSYENEYRYCRLLGYPTVSDRGG